jgi:hypothetical protein
MGGFPKEGPEGAGVSSYCGYRKGCRGSFQRDFRVPGPIVPGAVQKTVSDDEFAFEYAWA